ncbi:FmdB family zinc ribbon protein [Pseudonocardia hydrocarbonoxydans]|uniref:FmdB family zinc ribbon protein n=1 Tax=Pseudonocardia hydrocarbonoxydans TaxID=76726 RepID=UPI0011415074|nr:FmdB family zinc ribbon protein [Pseudonocardia hydrocarbonoxydans]
MPTYQYACTSCDHRFEAVQSFSDASLTECPQCSGPLRKVFSSVGIVFKGSGFYRTDSRSGAVPNGESKPAASSGESSGSADKGGGEKKPAEKSSKKDTGSSSAGTPAAAAAKT